MPLSKPALMRLTLPFAVGCVLGLLASARWLAGVPDVDGVEAAGASAEAAETPPLQVASFVQPSVVAPAVEEAPVAPAVEEAPIASVAPVLDGPAAEPPAAAAAPAEADLARQAREDSLGPGEDVIVLLGELGERETLSDALRTHGVSSRTVHEIATQMSGLFDFRYSQPKDQYRLIQGRDGTLLEFHYASSPFESYRVYREGEQYVSERREADLERRMARVAGVVDSSLYGAVTALGANPQLASDFADVFAWDVDFSRAVRSGDEFRILYERLFRKLPEGGEVFVGSGRILAARYSGAAGSHEAIYFETSKGRRGGYYRPDGSSVRRQFLKAPLKYDRISSTYTHSRLHPILKVRRPHLGIDYAAPMRTPVWAVADGRVIFKGWNGGLGKLVKIQHPNGYVTFYGHLSGYGPGLAVGSHVSQMQVIGYVGQTGLATGPHVHFHVKKGESYVNPASIKVPAGEPISSELQAEFALVRDAYLSRLDPSPLAAIDEAL
jgi:murein DD-endopeptidase MepM/ murein hydrolase activator NlpD